MMAATRRLLVAMMVSMGLLAAACGGSDDGTDAAEAPATNSPEATATAEPTEAPEAAEPDEPDASGASGASDEPQDDADADSEPEEADPTATPEPPGPNADLDFPGQILSNADGVLFYDTVGERREVEYLDSTEVAQILSPSGSQLLHIERVGRGAVLLGWLNPETGSLEELELPAAVVDYFATASQTMPTLLERADAAPGSSLDEVFIVAEDLGEVSQAGTRIQRLFSVDLASGTLQSVGVPNDRYVLTAPAVGSSGDAGYVVVAALSDEVISSTIADAAGLAQVPIGQADRTRTELFAFTPGDPADAQPVAFDHPAGLIPSGELALSPDGTTLAVVVAPIEDDGQDRELREVVLLDVETAELTLLPQLPPARYSEISWSPDGMWLLAESRPDLRFEHVVLRLDGSEPQPIDIGGYRPIWIE